MILALCVLAVGARAEAAVPAWRLTEAVGTVRVAEEGRVRSAARGATLKPGAVIATGRQSRAVLARGREYVVLAPNTRLRLPAAAERGIVQIIADAGSALFRIDRKATPHFGVRTRYLAAVVKGTTFRVTVTATGAAVGVAEGRVEVATAGGETRRVVNGGSAALVSADEPGRLTVGRNSVESGQDDMRDLAFLDRLAPRASAAAFAPLATPSAGQGPGGPERPWPLALLIAAGAILTGVLLWRARPARAARDVALARLGRSAAGAGPDEPRSVHVGLERAGMAAAQPAGSVPAVAGHVTEPALDETAPSVVDEPEPADEPADARRGAKRARVLLAANVEHGGKIHAVRLRDISVTGAVAEGDLSPEPGSRVTVRAERFAAHGEVLWNRDGRFGLRFDAPLDRSVLPSR